MQFKIYEHFHKLTEIGWTDAQRSLVSVLQTSGQTMLQCIRKQN